MAVQPKQQQQHMYRLSDGPVLASKASFSNPSHRLLLKFRECSFVYLGGGGGGDSFGQNFI